VKNWVAVQSVSLPVLRIHGSAQQADIPEAGCGFFQLGENRWLGPGNPGRWVHIKGLT